MKKVHSSEPHVSDRELFEAWVKTCEEIDEQNGNSPVNASYVAYPSFPAMSNLTVFIRELWDELKAEKKQVLSLRTSLGRELDAAAQAQSEAKDWKESYEAQAQFSNCQSKLVNDKNAELDKAHAANAELLAKAEKLLAEKRDLEERNEKLGALAASEGERRKASEKMRDDALKELGQVQAELLTEQLISARLEGYLEAVEDAKPPKLVAEAPGQTLADRISAHRQQANNRPAWRRG